MTVSKAELQKAEIELREDFRAIQSNLASAMEKLGRLYAESVRRETRIMSREDFRLS